MASWLVVRHKVYMKVGESPHSGRQTSEPRGNQRQRRRPAAAAHKHAKDPHARVSCEWEKRAVNTVTARILSRDLNLCVDVKSACR